MKNLEAEFIIVGSGAAGGTLARELARRGKKVIVLEKGREYNLAIGHAIAYALIYDILRTKEGVIIRRGITPGGSTVIYSGNSYDPPAWLADEYGLDISQEVDETKDELNIKPLPKDFYERWEGMKRLVDAAGEMDITMLPQDKFIDPRLCRPDCDDCLFGCKRGAKWTSRRYLEDAQGQGAQIFTGTDVKRVVVSNGRASGVIARKGLEEMEFHADKIILSAGGVGTPWILQASGIEKAGEGFFTDPMSILLGVSRGKGTFHEMTYTYASSDFLGQFIIGTTGAMNSLFAQAARLNFKSMLRAANYRHLVGMFVKLCDSPVGKVEPDRKISKPLTDEDNERMERGISLAKDIMTRSGVDPGKLQVARYIGGHPGGTAGIGRVVDNKLQTEIPGLYVCDSSVLPRSAGIPLVLTLVALAKKLAKEI